MARTFGKVKKVLLAFPSFPHSLISLPVRLAPHFLISKFSNFLIS
ncbi:hypothetical protein HMPREF9072_01555 [Capnocytophaga sp. oral taxon 324 str. F0483]|nr:hypothetical protein HMPREF9072_01555 [Capnocytophaga sp. oral taxon 324 str. F0483]